MESTKKIGTGQMLGILLCSRIVVVLTYSVNVIGQDISNAEWFSCLLMIPVFILLALPAFWLWKTSGSSVTDAAYTIWKPLGHILAVLYSLYFVVIDITYIARFNMFITTTQQPNRSAWFYPLIIMIPVCYAALKGLEAFSRTTGIIAIFGGIFLLLILFTVLPRFDLLNIISPVYYGPGKLLRPLRAFVANTTEIMALLMLLPRVKGKPLKTWIWFSVVAGIGMALIFLTTISVFGSFAASQSYPFYSIAGIAKLGEFRQLSALSSAIWLLGIFVKAALFLNLCSDSLKNIVPKKHEKPLILALSALIFVVSSLLSVSLSAANSAFMTKSWFVGILLFSTLIPLLLTIGLKLKKRRQAKALETSRRVPAMAEETEGAS